MSKLYKVTINEMKFVDYTPENQCNFLVFANSVLVVIIVVLVISIRLFNLNLGMVILGNIFYKLRNSMCKLYNVINCNCWA